MVCNITPKKINGINAEKIEIKLISYGLDTKSAAFELALLTADDQYLTSQYINVDNNDVLNHLNTNNDMIIDFILSNMMITRI